MIIATSAYANKLLRQFDEELAYLDEQERSSCTYVASEDEEPVVPDYDFEKLAARRREICDRIQKIKHAINVANTTQTIDVNGQHYTVDVILVRMAQLSRRKAALDAMRKRQPKERRSTGFSSSKSVEYVYSNYDVALAKQEFERVSAEIMALQLALDRHNQTYSFEIDVEL